MESFEHTVGHCTLRVTWQSLELVVGETEIGELGETKDTAWDVLQCIVGGIQFGQSVKEG